MIEILWEFVVRKDRISEFERNYCSTGSWAQLFGRSPAHRSTTLLRDVGQRYITRDCWDDLKSFRDFRQQHAQEYDELDRACEGYTESERQMGIFEVI